MQGCTVFTFGCDSTSGSLLHLLNIKSMNHQDFEPDPLYHWARILKHWLPSFGHQLAAAVLGVSWQRNVQIEQSNKTLHPKSMMTSVRKPLFEMCCFHTGIAQIALDPPTSVKLVNMWKSAPTILASLYIPQAKVDKKVLQTVLTSVYTRVLPPPKKRKKKKGASFTSGSIPILKLT